MSRHKLIISSAGSGKTTFLAQTALASPDQQILITTYTENNEREIQNKFIDEIGFIPKNITIQTWFSFLIQHGFKPFQGSLWEPLFIHDTKGLLLVNSRSGRWYFNNKIKKQVYYGSNKPGKFYFGKGYIYSDKLSKLVYDTNSASNGAIMSRIARIFDHIMIDEVQDLAGHDLEIIKLLMKSKIQVTMVGDPRQVTYLTHLEAKHSPYQDGKIEQFLRDKCKSLIKDGIDNKTLKDSHRCSPGISNLASRLYPQHTPMTSCGCCNLLPYEHEGVFLIKPNQVEEYLKKYNPTQLRWDRKVPVNKDYTSMNMGESKGTTMDRVLIYPTNNMSKWIRNNAEELASGTRAKFYVALTRAKYSSTIVFEYDTETDYPGMIKYNPSN